jgi:hypothetical protein
MSFVNAMGNSGMILSASQWPSAASFCFFQFINFFLPCVPITGACDGTTRQSLVGHMGDSSGFAVSLICISYT